MQSNVEEKERDELLVSLSHAVAARPMDREALQHASNAVEAKLGREALVEAAGVCGAFEVFTKLADSTGKEAVPASSLKVIGFVLKNANRMYSCFR